MVHKPYMNFKGWLTEKKLTYKDIGDKLGLSVATICAKINGQSDFTLSEVNMIRDKFGYNGNFF